VCPVAWSIQATNVCNRRQASGVVQHRQFEASGDAVVLLPLQVAAGLALANALPRFEEEGYFCFLTLVADRQDPLLLDQPCPRAALSAHNDPVLAVEVALAAPLQRSRDLLLVGQASLFDLPRPGPHRPPAPAGADEMGPCRDIFTFPRVLRFHRSFGTSVEVTDAR